MLRAMGFLVMNHTRPYISAEQNIAELTLRSILLAIFLTVILAMSNAYLALKLGILTSASIPAAILSMGILRLFKNATLLENNAVQTAASAGEAVAGGIVYTIPALIIIEYWHGFDYWTNFFIAASGGVLGVLFSIPLRRILVHEPILKFPEGRAIAAVLTSSSEKIGVSNIVMGGIIGALMELLQVGFKVMASSWNVWFIAKRSLFGFGAGFSATMMGAGYLIGHEMALSIFLGAVISWLIALPMVSHFYPEFLFHTSAERAANSLWNHEMRYMGIGAMLCAGAWTFLKIMKPLLSSIDTTLRSLRAAHHTNRVILRTEKDIPGALIVMGVVLMSILLFLFFRCSAPLNQAGLGGHYAPFLIVAMVMYVVVIGFLFSVITAYFSGMVGVTASPGSSVVIAGILFAAWLLLLVMNRVVPLPFGQEQMKAAEAITIIIGSVVTGIAAIANDNTQDLKVGQLVGATPWKQQVMLLIGVMVSSFVIPPVMQLLFNVYGISGVMPHEGMDMSQSLPAPTAALLAAVTEAVFRHQLPWTMIGVGACIIFGVLFFNRVFQLHRWVRLSVLGVAIGMYLPMSSSFPLFLGGMIAKGVEWRLHRKKMTLAIENQHKQAGTLIACGLVAGAALLDVLLAIPFSMLHSPDALRLVGEKWQSESVILSVVSILLLAVWINRRVSREPVFPGQEERPPFH
jgi:putative OPT family oligopeptide transporter